MSVLDHTSDEITTRQRRKDLVERIKKLKQTQTEKTLKLLGRNQAMDSMNTTQRELTIREKT